MHLLQDSGTAVGDCPVQVSPEVIVAGSLAPSSSVSKRYGEVSMRSGNSPSSRVRAGASSQGRLLLM